MKVPDLIKEAADQVAPTPSTTDNVDEKDVETGQQEGSDWVMKEFQQRLRALRGGEEDYPTHTPAKKTKMSITQGEAQGDEQDVKQKANPDRSMQEALANALSSPAVVSAMAKGLADEEADQVQEGQHGGEGQQGSFLFGSPR